MAFFNTSESRLVFESLPSPKSVWNYFLGLIETPRASGHQDIIKPLLVEFGKALGLESCADEVGNVIIRKPASSGCEKWPGICLQAHYDIVAVKLDNVIHDFRTDPLKPRLLPSPDEHFGKSVLQATGTSLGADDGIGVAIIFGILADPALKHGPLEGLITTDEETTFAGAIGLKPGVLKSKYLINLDHSKSWSICIGCAGGFEKVLHFPLKRTVIDGIRIQVHLKGLRGGHSAREIKDRANGIKLLAEALHEAGRISQAQNVLALQSFVGGDKRNAIPFSVHASLVIPVFKKEIFLTSLQQTTMKLKTEWHVNEPDLEFVISVDEGSISTTSAEEKEKKKEEGKAKAGYVVFDFQSTQKTLDLIHTLPHGVLRLSPTIADLVETSINLSRVVLVPPSSSSSFTDAGTDRSKKNEGPNVAVTFEFLARSSDGGQLEFVQERLVAIARLGGGTCEKNENEFPAWQPEPNSSLVQVAQQVYRELNGSEAEIFATHSGLECGQFLKTYPGIKCISVGPYYTGMHSVEEMVYVETVADTYNLVTGILAKLQQ